MKKQILAIMKEELKKYKYKKKNTTFFKKHNGATIVINLQGSQWGDSCYLNLALLFDEAGPEVLHIKESDGHLRFRIEEYNEVENTLGKMLYSGMALIDAVEFKKEFIRVIPHLDNYLCGLTDKKTLIKLVESKERLRYMMTKELVDWLGVRIEW